MTKMFTCQFCHTKSREFVVHLRHLEFHKSLTNYFHCGYQGCQEFFSNENNLRVHIIRHHGLYVRKEHKVVHEHCRSSSGKFKCTVGICQKEIVTFSKLLKHLKTHINEGLVITCPYGGCNKEYEVVSSFTCHLSRSHRSVAKDVLPVAQEQQQSSQYFEPMEPMDIDDIEVQVDISVNEECEVTESDLFMKNLGLFYLKLETQFRIPASTIQFIVSQLNVINDLQSNLSNENLKTLLFEMELPENKVKHVIKKLSSENPLATSKKLFETDYLRKKFYKTLSGYVQPKQFRVNYFEDQTKLFHYITIQESVRSVLQDNYLKSFLGRAAEGKENVLSDFSDGSMFKRNKFFRDNPEAIQIILYEDEFEVVNPIGAAKTKYKILACYMTIGNLPYHVRSSINNIQLVALCKSKNFNQKAVYGRIVTDILKIEKEGIEIAPGQWVKGGVIYIAGDNLGSHGLGGFMENFSTSEYFCRYCLIQRKYLNNFTVDAADACLGNGCNASGATDATEVQRKEVVYKDVSEFSLEDSIENAQDEAEGSEPDDALVYDSLSEESEAESVNDYAESDGDVTDSERTSNHEYVPNFFPKRTPESYDQALSVLHLEQKNNVHGIKFDSIFNQLESFHVCAPGLPPCLAHDLLEGVIAVDLVLFADYFVKKKEWFTYSELNLRLEKFPYSNVDGRDKPVPLNAKSKRVVGGAWQVWCFLRLLPLLIGDKIQNKTDEVWISLLKLIEIMEICTAPNIHTSYISYLQEIINEYLYQRVSLFPDTQLRPKHHFLSHYPQLIQEFGPLMKSCTLRFESKHGFFKQCLRSLRNYKNVTYSLSVKHQLYQALLREGGGYKKTTETFDERTFHEEVFNTNIQEAVRKANLNHENVLDCAKAVIESRCYQKGDIVVTSQECYQHNVEMGRIVLLLSDNDSKVHLVLEILETTFRPELRLYQLGDILRHDCVPVDTLLSHEPLHPYKFGKFPCVKLKYGIVATPL